MIPIQQLTGRLGNQMFQFAFMYSYAKDYGIDFYFQDEKWFKDYAKQIRAIFSQGIGEPIDQVSIHVRRGDYVGHWFYTDLSKTDYYERAMALFPDASFLVFSDNIEWCKEQEMFKDCDFFHGTELEDLNMMASCKNNIIANSSFSWWAGWLNANPDKKVIAPKKWHTDGVSRTKIPDSWIQI